MPATSINGIPEDDSGRDIARDEFLAEWGMTAARARERAQMAFSGPVPPEESQLPNLPGITLSSEQDHALVPVGSIVQASNGRRYRVEGHAPEGHLGPIDVLNSAAAVADETRRTILFRHEYPSTVEEAIAADPGPERDVAAAAWGVSTAELAPVRNRPRRMFESLLRRPVPAPIKRAFFWADLGDPDDRIVQKRRRVSEEKANLVSSLIDDGDEHTRMHAPVLDIDMPCRLVPSTTEGHFHLYIDKAMTWERYALLLNALMRAGIIEEGFYKMSMKREATFVRKPGIEKQEGDISSSEDVPEEGVLEF